MYSCGIKVLNNNNINKLIWSRSTTWWLTTEQTALSPQNATQGSTQRPSRQAEAEGQSRSLTHSPRGLHPPLMGSPTWASGQEQMNDPGVFLQMEVGWQTVRGCCAHSSMSTHWNHLVKNEEDGVIHFWGIQSCIMTVTPLHLNFTS